MSGVRRGKQGTSMGAVEKAPWRKKRETKRRKRQEERWAARSGPVVVRESEEQEPKDPSTDA